jgi:hypothetical protein
MRLFDRFHKNQEASAPGPAADAIFCSTRGGDRVTAMEAVLRGMAPDGQAGTGGQAAGVIDDEDALFIASFIEYGVLGLLRDWIDGGMKGDTEVIIARFGMLINAFTK